MKKTLTTLRIADLLLHNPTGRHWTYRLAKETGMQTGTVHPILTRMFNAGWLSDGWEDPQTYEHSRPPRRYYELTEHGLNELKKMVQSAPAHYRVYLDH